MDACLWRQMMSKFEDEEQTTMSDVAERVKKIVVEHLGVDADKVIDSANFMEDLGADSLDGRARHGVRRGIRRRDPDDAAETIVTVGDAIKFLESIRCEFFQTSTAGIGLGAWMLHAPASGALNASAGRRAMGRTSVNAVAMGGRNAGRIVARSFRCAG
jgi:acyl carrier protein